MPEIEGAPLLDADTASVDAGATIRHQTLCFITAIPGSMKPFYKHDDATALVIGAGVSCSASQTTNAIMIKRVCSSHLNEDYLNGLITRSQVSDERCSYCAEVTATISLDVLAEHFDWMFGTFFQSASEGGWQDADDVETVEEVLARKADIHDELAKDLTQAIRQTWFNDVSSFWDDEGNFEDQRFLERKRYDDQLGWAWEKMTQSLKHEARLVNPQVIQLLDRIFGPVLDDLAADGNGVVVEAGPSKPYEKLYRARVFQTDDALEEALTHPERTIGPPPDGTGNSGRMNARGVSVFYGSTARSIAVAEVRPPVGASVVVAGFKIQRDLRLLDLARLARINATGSYFDPATVARYERRDFLATLSRRMVMPVMPELEDQSYLTTQAIADYLATHPTLKLDGIVFNSAQHGMGHAELEGVNVVLFHKASYVLNSEKKNGPTASVNLADYDEDHYVFSPSIRSVTKPDKPLRGLDALLAKAMPPLVPPLLLDLDDIQISRVKGVQYDTADYRVSH